MSEVSLSKIENMIYQIRGYKVLVDSDLAELYGVEIKRLNDQVKRNQERFPDNIMFQFSIEERDILRSQIATLKNSMGTRKYLLLIFTENGVTRPSRRRIHLSRKLMKGRILLILLSINFLL